MFFNEIKIVEAAKPYFKTARAGDWSHALRVVEWVKRLAINRDDLGLLITAAYIHDIGWSGVAPQGLLDLSEIIKLEQRANENSSRLIREVLSKLNFQEDNIQTVDRLVKAADKHRGELDDEKIIVDADNLSKLDLDHFKEKYKPDSWPKMLEVWEREFSQRISTNLGKKEYPILLEGLKKKINVQ